MNIRRFIRNSAFLYPLYVRWILKGGNKVTPFPSKEIELHLTGFPRSANTYCYNIIKVAFPTLKLSTHIHTIASLKLAKSFEIPTIILLRDPLSTTTSLLLKGQKEPNEKDISSILRDYIDYHDYVLNNCNDAMIVCFDRVTKEPSYIIERVSEVLGVDMSKELIGEKGQTGLALLKEKEKTKKKSGSSLPNKEREEKKKRYRSAVTSNVDYVHAQFLYGSIVKTAKLFRP